MAKFKARIDLSAFFNKESKNLVSSYKGLLTSGRGVRQDDAPRKMKDNRKPWLINTGDTRQNGIERKYTKSGMIVFASSKKHSGKTRWVRKDRTVGTGRSKRRPTYRQLFKWHNRGRSSALSESYSGIFNEFPANSKFGDRLEEEVMRQTKREVLRLVRAFNGGK